MQFWIIILFLILSDSVFALDLRNKIIHKSDRNILRKKRCDHVENEIFEDNSNGYYYEDTIFHDYQEQSENNNYNDYSDQYIDESELIRLERAKNIEKFIDFSIDPCEDFYEYACGNWKKIHQVPDKKSKYNVLDKLTEELDVILRNLLSEPSESVNGEINAEDKAKMYFQSCMNTEMLDSLGVKLLQDHLKAYGGFPAMDGKTQFDWLNLTIFVTLFGESTLLTVSVSEDFENSNDNIIFITEGDLVLANREDYLSDGEANVNHLNAYKKLMQNVMELMGIDHDIVITVVDEIINFETELAKIMFDPKGGLDVVALFRRYTVKDLYGMHPEIDWIYYISVVLQKQIDLEREVGLFGREDYIGDLIKLTSATEPRIVVNFILWKWIKSMLKKFDGRFDNVLQEFSESLTGQQVKTPRWQKCVKETNEKLGWAVGALFIKKNFDEQSRKDITLITQQLQETFREIIENLDWVDDATKSAAYEKLKVLDLEIGYPDFIVSQDKLNMKYEDVLIHSERYFENYLRISYHLAREELNKLEYKVNRDDWQIVPVTVNAHMDPTSNRIFIYTGILQKPIYHKLYPRALNYGSIGFIIGHELTHGYDDLGRNFDGNGDLKPWWTNSSVDNFKEKSDCFIQQYGNYTFGEKPLNPIASLNEDIADNGGIREAFITYKKWLETTNDFEALQRETLPGLDFTSTQLFFLSFAQTWCANVRPEAIENLIETDFHSPDKFRVIGPLSNFEAFSEEFNCPLGSPMNPSNKCKLWG